MSVSGCSVPKHALSNGESLLGDGGRLLVFALAVKLDHLLIEGVYVLRAFCVYNHHADKHQDYRRRDQFIRRTAPYP